MWAMSTSGAAPMAAIHCATLAGSRYESTSGPRVRRAMRSGAGGGLTSASFLSEGAFNVLSR